MRSHLRLPLALIAAVATAGIAAAAEQLPNLNEEKPAARFQVTDHTWPAEPGQAAICLWRDDKLAAISVTVDDNTAPDVPWWLEVSERYDFPVTWFIITDRLDDPTRAAYFGTWELFADVLAKGHAIESHTHTHLHVEKPDWQSIEWEYAESQKLIAEHLSHKARFLAYPGGKNKGLNDRDVAAKYYAAARGVTGSIPAPNRIDYLEVRCASEAAFDNPKTPWADLKNLLNPEHRAYRGWGVLLYHAVKDKNPQKPLLQFFDEQRENLWFCTFGEGALYGQERDTATLSVKESSDTRIVLDLSDRMDDAVFDYPLTLKVRLPASWTQVVAQQGEMPVSAKVIQHEGAAYALVQAVPDRGPITLTSR